MRIDLHVHSDRSDGAYPPAEVARIAREAGLDAIALTDHDTTEGLAEARAAGETLGLEVLTGCEVSARYANDSVHVLAYFFDPANPALAGVLSRIRDDRVWRAQRMVERLNELGVPVTFERVREIAKGETIARPHVAQAMVEAGVVVKTTDAFTQEWIGNGGRASVEKYAPAPVEAIGAIREAGGAAVLAHPIWLVRDRSMPEEHIEELAAAGLAGIEVDHPDHDDAARARYRALAGRLALVATGSSDWHGNLHGGKIGENVTPPEAVEALRERAGAARA